ncbi:hypothetical protein NZD85_08540 [Empedobacter stercoris]|uniref:hypothetical protein n=1 Tax=Empedobacter stercoris TaxID=1628248 RepID=UPI0021AE8FCF|nr:hypothetical protein [Empedobacter stercoris]UWX65949.1 hypothetical protein NZD85_08540 [Empedobacter stercoris]
MKLMKKLSMFALVSALGLSTFSCLDDDGDFTNYGFLPTTDIYVHKDSIMPVGEKTNIHVTYQKANSCQNFIQFSSLSGDTKFKHHIGVYASQASGSSCVQELTSETKTLNFTPKEAGQYTLKFWTGNNIESNKPIYDSIILDIKEK